LIFQIPVCIVYRMVATLLDVSGVLIYFGLASVMLADKLL
jgi:Mg/Co/Ni transporter MgtE